MPFSLLYHGKFFDVNQIFCVCLWMWPAASLAFGNIPPQVGAVIAMKDNPPHFLIMNIFARCTSGGTRHTSQHKIVGFSSDEITCKLIKYKDFFKL